MVLQCHTLVQGKIFPFNSLLTSKHERFWELSCLRTLQHEDTGGAEGQFTTFYAPFVESQIHYTCENYIDIILCQYVWQKCCCNCREKLWAIRLRRSWAAAAAAAFTVILTFDLLGAKSNHLVLELRWTFAPNLMKSLQGIENRSCWSGHLWVTCFHVLRSSLKTRCLRLTASVFYFLFFTHLDYSQ